MSNVQHTLSRWNVDYEFNRRTFRIISSSNKMICGFSRGSDVTQQEFEANAKLLCSSPKLLAALEAAKGKTWVHNAAITQDIEALRAICLEFAAWWNGVAVSAIELAKGEAA